MIRTPRRARCEWQWSVRRRRSCWRLNLGLESQLHAKVAVRVENLDVGKVVELALALDERRELNFQQLLPVRECRCDRRGG